MMIQTWTLLTACLDAFLCPDNQTKCRNTAGDCDLSGFVVNPGYGQVVQNVITKQTRLMSGSYSKADDGVTDMLTLGQPKTW